MSFWTLVVLAIGFITATALWAVVYLQEGKLRVYWNGQTKQFGLWIGDWDDTEK